MADQNKDAEVSVGIGGQDRVIKAAQDIGDAWRKAAKGASGEWKAFGSAIKGEVAAMARDISSIATATSKISFSAGAESARTFGLDVNRFAAAAGKSADEVKAKFQSIGRAKMLPDDQVLALSKSLRAVTYDAGYAVDSIGAIADEAEAMDRSPQSVLQLAGAFKTAWNASGNAGKSFKEVRGIVEALRPTNGLNAIHDRLQAMAGSAARLGMGLRETTALISTFGKGSKWTEEQRQQGLGTVISTIEGNRRVFEHLGKQKEGAFLNPETGAFDPSKALPVVQKWLKSKPLAARRRLEQYYFNGVMPGMMLEEYQPEEAAKAVNNAKESDAAAAIAEQNLGGWEARVTKAQQERERNERKAGGFLGENLSGYSQWAADNPWSAGAIDKVGGAAGSTLGTGTMAAASLWLAKKFGVKAIAGTLGKVATRGVPLLGAAATGWSLGGMADDAWGLSDRIAGVGGHSRIGADDAAAFEQDEKRRALASWEETRTAGDKTLTAGRSLLGQGDEDRIAGALAKALDSMNLQAQVVMASDGTPQKVTIGKSSTAQL